MASVAVTPRVVSWAVTQSGFSIDEIADAVDADVKAVRAWIEGTDTPSLGEARKLAHKLRRPLAFLLWPEPPSAEPPQIAFRAPVAADLRDLNPTERRFVRQARRMQALLEHLASESGTTPPSIPRLTLDSSAAAAAKRARSWLGIKVDEQIGWGSEYVALKQWRIRFEERGLFVFALALGGDSCRGMTLASEQAPVVIVNTAFNPRARIFTLFHELAHVLTRTTSACAASVGVPDGTETTERWCDEFAASALMPWNSVADFLAERGVIEMVKDVATAEAVARRYKVSLPAATLTLIAAGRATWELWRKIPRRTNDKPESGGGGGDEPRTTPVVRLSEFGLPAASALVRGVRASLIDRSRAASHLRVDDESLTEIESRVDKAQAG